jgi:DNA-binding CsgD family transcriptional regulator
MTCAGGGQPELREDFDAIVAGLAPGVPAELELLARTQADPAGITPATLGQLDAAVSGLPHETDHRRTLILGSAAARTDRLAGCREALRQLASDALDGGGILPAIDALTLLCLDGVMTGAWDEALRLAGECLRACQSYGHPSRAWMVREQLAMIAAARGDDELVRELTGDMLRWATPRNHACAAGRAPRVLARGARPGRLRGGLPGISRDQPAGDSCRRQWPFELARVQLAYGEHLRRVRATGDARAQLGAALDTFRALGARPWADRAANELRATRLTIVKPGGHHGPVLTAQEHQIASLAAAGLTNKQIGQRLYLSHRTVGAHLYRVFPKLGISTRAGLRDPLVALEPGARSG